MKRLVRNIGVFLLLTLSGIVIGGDERYRIAGVIASSTAAWRAIVELPDGEQRLVDEGDILGQVEVVRISKEGVTLQFPGGERSMQLSQGDYIPQPGVSVQTGGPVPSAQSGGGVVAGDFSERVSKQLDPTLLGSVRGLEVLSSLSESARIVSYSYLGDPEAGHTPIDSLESGVDLLQEAIVGGKEIRITIEGDESFRDFYVMPNQME